MTSLDEHLDGLLRGGDDDDVGDADLVHPVRFSSSIDFLGGAEQDRSASVCATVDVLDAESLPRASPGPGSFASSTSRVIARPPISIAIAVAPGLFGEAAEEADLLDQRVGGEAFDRFAGP